MQVSQNLMNEMIKNVADPGLRDRYAMAISGKYPKSIYCMKPQKRKHKPGKLIGYIDNRDHCIEENTQNKAGEFVAGLFTSRDRFDGLKGFRCHCGNSSIVCDEEADTVVPGWTPNQKDMAKIWNRLQGSNCKQSVEGPVMEYDGFKVEVNQ